MRAEAEAARGHKRRLRRSWGRDDMGVGRTRQSESREGGSVLGLR